MRAASDGSRLPQLTPIRTGVVVPACDFDQGGELLVALVAAADIARIDAQLGQRLGTLGHLGQQLVAIEMEIANQRHATTQRIEALTNARHRSRGFERVDRDAHQFRSGLGQCLDLLDGCGDIGGIGVGHRLHHDRRIATNQNMTNPHLAGGTTDNLRHHSSRVKRATVTSINGFKSMGRPLYVMRACAALPMTISNGG